MVVMVVTSSVTGIDGHAELALYGRRNLHTVDASRW
jgi:hypothetical protein